MTQEQKAKAYDEAIRKLRNMMPNWERLPYNGKTVLQDLIYIFPELKESEGERIRKEILEYFQQFENEKLRGVNISNWIDWLEKQGQKPAWSEEDKKKLNRIYYLIAEAANEHAFSTTCRLIGDKECVELQDFLKSLKQRIGG